MFTNYILDIYVVQKIKKDNLFHGSHGHSQMLHTKHVTIALPGLKYLRVMKCYNNWTIKVQMDSQVFH